jgi:hypothetical protein
VNIVIKLISRTPPPIKITRKYTENPKDRKVILEKFSEYKISRFQHDGRMLGNGAVKLRREYKRRGTRNRTKTAEEATELPRPEQNPKSPGGPHNLISRLVLVKAVTAKLDKRGRAIKLLFLACSITNIPSHTIFSLHRPYKPFRITKGN